MSTSHLILFSVPGLRRGDITPELTPALWGWVRTGGMTDLVPTFPCVTSPVQASILTGRPPREHGVIANGFYHRDRDEVEFWTGGCEVVQAEPVWETLRRTRPGLTSAVWHVQNIKRASADFIVTPAPIHEPDGTTRLWCYSRPDGLYGKLLAELGHFPLQHYWGPLSGIQSTQWILRAALWLLRHKAPNFNVVYIPHLDYAGQKHGPDSPQARQALLDLDRALGGFADEVAHLPLRGDIVYMVAGEYAMTDVCGVIYPNRVLRQAGLLKIATVEGHEQVDLRTSPAFAMVDHQLAHIYIRRAGSTPGDRSCTSPPPTDRIEHVADLFRGMPGIAGVFAGDDRRDVGLDHERSGDIVLVSAADHWFAYYWWLEDDLAPSYARTVDIHRKPGYDPVELFFDPATKSIPLNAELVRGSHGAPVGSGGAATVFLTSHPHPGIHDAPAIRDLDVAALVIRRFQS